MTDRVDDKSRDSGDRADKTEVSDAGDRTDAAIDEASGATENSQPDDAAKEGAAAYDAAVAQDQAAMDKTRAAMKATAPPTGSGWTPEEQAAIDKGTAQGVQEAAEDWLGDVVDGVVEAVTISAQGAVVAAKAMSQLPPALQNAIPGGPVLAAVGHMIPDAFSDAQAESLEEKVDAALKQIEDLPEVPKQLKEKYAAEFAYADALRDAYLDGRADLDVLEESARVRAKALAEIAILTAEAGSTVAVGAGWAIKAARGLGKLDLDIPGGALAALERTTEARKWMADSVRRFIVEEDGGVPIPGQTSKLTKEILELMWEGKRFDQANAHRYEYNEITLENGKRVDSINLSDGNAQIVSRKNTQLAEVEVATGIGYLNELSEKYKPGTKIPNTAKNVQLKIAGQRLSGPQILEVPVQTAPVPQELMDKAKELKIQIRDVEGNLY